MISDMPPVAAARRDCWPRSRLTAELHEWRVVYRPANKARPGRALLWIADAWCWSHGRQWQDRISPVVRTVTTL